MRKPDSRNQIQAIVGELESGLADIDREMGVIAYQAVVLPVTQALDAAPAAANSLAALINNGVTAAGQKAYEGIVVKPLNVLSGLTYSPIVELRLAEERSAWERFIALPTVSVALSKLSPQAHEALADFMSRRVGAASLMAQFTSVKKLMFSATIAATAFGGVIDSQIGQSIIGTTMQYTGLAHQDAQSVTGLALILGAVGVKQILGSSCSYRLHSNHDALRAKIDQWNAGIDQGWAGVAKSWIARGLALVVTPHPPLSDQSREALRSVVERGGMLPQLQADDQKSLDTVASFISHEFRVGQGRASQVAADMLINGEPDPSRLMSLLRARHLPQSWIDKYEINPATCISVPEEESAPASIEQSTEDAASVMQADAGCRV